MEIQVLISASLYHHLSFPLLFSSLLYSLLKMDHDPRNPTYISSQGPLPTTVADFWQVKLLPFSHFVIAAVYIPPDLFDGVKVPRVCL